MQQQTGGNASATSRPWGLRKLVERGLRLFLDLRPGEGPMALSMAGLFFLVVASYYLIKPVRNSLFVQRVGADNLPYVYIGTAFVIGVLISWYSSHVVDRVRPRRLIPITYGFLASNLVLFSLLVRHESLATSAAFYIWAKLYPVLVVSQFWLMANALFDPRQAKRLFGFIGAGGILGGITGGALAGTMAEIAGTENLLLISAVTTVVCAGIAMRVYPDSTAMAAPIAGRGRPAGDGAAASAARLVRQSSHLRAISAILTLTIIVSTVVDWQMNKAVELFVAGEDAKTAFYGRFFAILNGASFLVQVVFTSYVLKRFGIGVALLLLPLGLFTGALGLLIHPALWTAAAAKGIDGTLRYSLDQSTRELLFFPVPHAVKVRAKPFIDVAVQRGGTGLGGVLILLMTSVGQVPFHYMSLVSLVAIGVWIVVVFAVRREYVQSIKGLIQARDVEVDELVLRTLDADHRRELLIALEGDDPERVLYALGLLELAGEIPAPDQHLAKLIRHPNAEVRERAAAVLARHGDHVLLKAVEPLLEDEDFHVRGQAVRLLCRHCVGDELLHFQMLLSDRRPPVRAGAIAGYYDNPDPRLSALAATELQKLARESGPEGPMYRREAALLTAILPSSDTTLAVLLHLLEDPDEAVRRAAMLAAGRGGHRQVVPLLIRALGAPRKREAARAGLTMFGDRIVGTLADHLRDRSERRDIRIQLTRVFVELPLAMSVESLLEVIGDPDPAVRYHVLKALNRLRRDHPDLAFRSAPVEHALRVELDLLAGLQGARAALPLDSAGELLLLRVLDEREDDAVERITRCLGLLYPLDDVFHAYRAIAQHSSQDYARGIELLDNLLQPRHRQAVIPLLERLGGTPGESPPSTLSALRSLDPWPGACLAFVEMKRSLTPKTSLSIEDQTMMTIVERANFLREVGMFSLVRTDYLAKIAAVVKERQLASGETLFRQGSPPQAIFFVVDGEIHAIRDGEQVWVARRGDAVAALPVLDRKPTMVTAVAAMPTRLLFVEDELFNDLMLDNPALPLGIIRFLAGEVRRLVSERHQEAVLA